MKRAVDVLALFVFGMVVLCAFIGLTTDSPTAWPSAFSCLTSLIAIVVARRMTR